MKTLHAIYLLPFLFSCSDAIKKQAETVQEDSSVIASPVEVLLEPRFITENTGIKDEKDLYGYWVGAFLPDDSIWDEEYDGDDFFNYRKFNKINISIDSLFKDSIIGHSVVAGNRRKFTGVWELKNNTYTFKVSEPGDDKYDGEFVFRISISDSVLNGTWKAYNSIETPKRIYSLKKRKFMYDPVRELYYSYVDWNKIKKVKETYEGDEYIVEKMFQTTGAIHKFNPSAELLTKKQVENMKKADIFILRNSIYAKHGFSFKKRPLRYFFDLQEWYIPMYTDIRMYLTDTEKKNIELLLRYEKHAEEYYDAFGR